MAPQLVVGLFRSAGIAEDARNRLQTEGVPRSELALAVLKPAAPVLPTSAAELEALTVDPLVFGDIRNSFADFIRNGETAVLVRTPDGAQAELAAVTLRQYAPLAVNVLPIGATPASSKQSPSAGQDAEPQLRPGPLRVQS
jgi:hypothetical protein